MNRMSKADHMLAIMLLLRARGRMTARQLAEELEIHIRSVYRYVDALCVSGVPIVSETGRDGGYSIPERFKLEPLFFEHEEQKSLLHAARFARESGYPHEEALNRAIAKIKRYAVPEQAGRLDAQETYLEVVRPAAAASLAPVLREIEAAMERQTSLELEYLSGYDGILTQRLFDPYGVVNWKDNWYAVGLCHLRGDVRHFRVDRIRSLEQTDAGFVRPDGFSAGESLLAGLLPGAAGDGGAGRLVIVVIQAVPDVLDDLCAHWLLSRALVRRDGERAYYELDEGSLYDHLPYYLLSFGGRVRVEEPQSLRECLADIAEAICQHHRSELGKH